MDLGADCGVVIEYNTSVIADGGFLREFSMQIQAFLAHTRRLLKHNAYGYSTSFLILRVFQLGFAFGLAHLVSTSNVSLDKKPQSDFATFVLVGALLVSHATALCLTVGRCLMVERRANTMDTLLLAPSGIAPYFAAQMTQQIAISSIDTCIVIVIFSLFSTPLDPIQILMLLSFIIITYFSMFGIALMLCILIFYTKESYIMHNTFSAFIAYSSGAYFALELIPQWYANLCRILPITHVIQAARLALAGEGIRGIAPTVTTIIWMTILYTGAAIVLYRNLEESVLRSE